MSIMLMGGVLFNEENFFVWFLAGVICVGMGLKLFLKELIVN